MNSRKQRLREDVYKRQALQFYCSSPRGKIESIEDIEILRFIEAGYRVQYIEVDSEKMCIRDRNQAYPDKKISGLYKDHKKWGETVTDGVVVCLAPGR